MDKSLPSSLLNQLLGAKFLAKECSATSMEAGECSHHALGSMTEFVRSNSVGAGFLLSMFLPLALGLFVGVWVGNQQSRSKKSFYHIITSWFSSVYSIVQFWHAARKSQQKRDQARENPFQQESVKVVSTGKEAGKEVAKNYVDTPVEAGVPLELVPNHIAVIMDGNRRYGKRTYGKGTMGHFDGGKMALQVIEWCSTEGVKVLTLYAFSTENWKRSAQEVDHLMGLFLQFVENDLRPVVFNRKVKVVHLYTDGDNVPKDLMNGIKSLEDETKEFQGLTLNICMSYGSRAEIIGACQKVAKECVEGKLKPEQLTEDLFSQRLQTGHCADPDVLVRTSAEERISNFLLWQLAYTELFFIDKDWPELQKEDILKVIRTFALSRQRRFGK
jgi:undecaprenyl diphosphate synthase